MKTFAITTAAVVCAVAVTLSTRFVVPVAILLFRAIEESFTPAEPQLAVAALPVAVADAPVEEPAKPALRRARRRKPSKALLQKVEAIS